jgi:GrpB-like predicted nucleotidyltransferase (UPF0157 family)
MSKTKVVAKKVVKKIVSTSRKVKPIVIKKTSSKKVITATKSKTTKPKTLTPAVLVKKILLKAENENRMVEWEDKEKQKELVIGDWAKRLTSTKQRLEKLNNAYIDVLLKLLQEAYAVYGEVIRHELADVFFAELRGQLHSAGIKIQSNTPDASLVIRYICGNGYSSKSFSQYSRVLQAAEYNQIEPTNFVDWVKDKTMTKVVDEYRALENNTETRADRMSRARRVVMRLIEARETKPLLSGKTTAWKAERMLGKEGLWIGIGNATRRMDRENFYADINLAFLLPPNIDTEIFIINALAREIVDSVERYENEIATLEEAVWADALWERLVSAGFEESDKSNEYWSNRQQAARYEDQQDFIEEVVKVKKRKGKK